MKVLKMLCRRGISMLIVLVMCASILQVTAFAAEADEPSDGGESGMVSITLHDDKTTVAVNGNVVAENISLADPAAPAADQTPAKDETTQWSLCRNCRRTAFRPMWRPAKQSI